MQILEIKNSITINAPVEKVWDALVNPEKTKQYMFGCETVSDWKVGSTLNWQAFYEGKNTIFVTGKIVSIEPNKKLVYTTFDPNSSMQNIPENHLYVICDLVVENKQTILNVTQGNYATVAEGERRYKEASNNGEGWNPILVEVKKLVESN